MTKLDPIVAVKDVKVSILWYEEVFGFRKAHETGEIAVLVTKDDKIVLCLHQWGDPGHPSMRNPEVKPGNGLMLYFRTDDLNEIRQNAQNLGAAIEEDIHTNSNSTKKEFSLRDPDGYYLTVTEYHEYGG